MLLGWGLTALVPEGFPWGGKAPGLPSGVGFVMGGRIAATQRAA